MIYLGTLLSLIGVLLGFMLILRLRHARAIMRSAIAQKDKGSPSRLLVLLERELTGFIDRDLLGETGPRGLVDVTLKFREAHDASDVNGILRAIAKTDQSRQAADIVELTKYLFMLQYSLGMPVAQFDECLQEVTDRLKDLLFHGRRIATVTIPREQDLFDAKTMWALKPGSRVRQPMGVTLTDESGRVLSKSKVLCQ